VAIMLFWVAIGIVYSALAAVECIFALEIKPADLQPIKRYAAGTQEQFDKFVKEVRGGSPAENEYTRQAIIDWSQ
jgi:hypothetical protein